MLVASPTPLCRSYDVAMLDLDGVVYVGPDAVPGAPAALAAAREAGMRLAFVTNNAARPPSTVAAHLTELGIPAQPQEIITSAQAAARYLSERLPAGAPVLVVGTTGLIEALEERGLHPVHSAEARPAAVVQGYSPDTDWRMLAEGAVAIRTGVPWVATNLDATVPSPRGPLPGNGSLVASLRVASGVEPVATGKPDPTMHRETVIRTGAERPIVVGDRLDTDIAGARAVGCASLLVLSGVTTPRILIDAPAAQRPDYLGRDVAALLGAHPGVEVLDAGARCGSWLARTTVAESGVTVELRSGTADSGGTADGLDALRALCTARWSVSAQPDDAGARPSEIVAADEKAAGELATLLGG